MTGHPSTLDLERHAARTLAPADLLRVDEHLSACDACHQKLVGLAGLPGAATQVSLPTPAWEGATPHLEYEQLAAYVDGTIDDVEREVADGHLLFCKGCADAVKDLSEFSSRIAPAPPVKTPARTVTAKPVSGFAANVRGWLSSLSPLKVGAALAAAAVLVVAVTWLAQRASLRNTREVAREAPVTRVPEVKPPADGNQTASGGQQSVAANANGVVAGANAGAGHANERPVTPSEKPAPAKVPPARGTDAEPPLVALNDGARRVGLGARGDLVGLESLPPATRRAVRESLSREGLKRPAALDELAGQGGTLLDAEAEGVPFALIGPAGIVVEDARPVLRWERLEGATRYVVSVFDEEFRRVASSGQLTATSWQPARPLARGRVYTWQVTAQKDGREMVSPVPPAPEARFKILDAARLREITEARRLSPDSHLTLGVLYARAGLIEGARKELQELVRQNPDSKLARKLFDSLQSWQRR